ncbi:MAG: hypothetical protein PHQ66_01330 [Candidatus Nanoarchaeia archaeon]|nr:hypothetical protein [Candidatus Nanoarchaeia archaeon]MDD5357981.1 hypothetical protein [Candidatus Nanoarchaeia archaeon]MDD5588900.1 hypothetical protein [Candidatus Nanoarchaeia archaeon]
MFRKNKCSRCKKTIEEKYSFCPYCGSRVVEGDDSDDWGMLGKDDFFSPANDIKLPAGFNSIFNALMKNLSKEMDSQLKENLFDDGKNTKKIKKDGISISISTFGNGPPKIKVSQMGASPKIKEEKDKFKSNLFTKEKTKEFASLPREEPETSVRRFSDKIVYELEMPDVKSAEDISIVKLENSIEIKAIGKKKAYAKIIPINLPIKNYELSNGKLTLELGVKN